MRELLIRLSDLLYKWILEAPGHKEYHQVYENVQNGGCGMMWTFLFLLVISIAAASVYYFVVSNSVVNANKRNYFTVGVLGLFALIVATVVGLRLITGYNDAAYWSSNLVRINLLNIVYYAIFYEVWSLIMMPFSKSSIHMFSK